MAAFRQISAIDMLTLAGSFVLTALRGFGSGF